MFTSLRKFITTIFNSTKDLAPVIVVVTFFQLVVLQQPIPDLTDLIIGSILVILGLTFFVYGLNMGLFPLGQSLAYDFARKGNLFWLLTFSFCLGFGTTIAEPALIAISEEAARIAASAKLINPGIVAMQNYADGLRFTVALSVGIATIIGVYRIIRGWPLQYVIIGGYLLVVLITFFAPAEIIGIAYDSGGVTTSTITVPLITALGIGLASSIKGRNPMLDGFGLIALASLTPMIFVMLYGVIVHANPA